MNIRSLCARAACVCMLLPALLLALGISGICSPARAAAVGSEPMRVVYGFDREFPPFSFEDAGGKAVGFEVELIEAIFKSRSTLVMRPLQWDMVPLELASGTINITSGMVKTEQRSKTYSFTTRASFPLQIRLFTKNYNRYPNATFLRGQTVAVEEKSYQLRLLQEFGGINIKPYKDKVSPLRALYNDEVVGYCGPMQNAYYYMNKLNFTAISTLGTPLGITELRFAVNRYRGDVLKMANDGLNELVKNGEYDRIYRKWFVSELSAEESSALMAAAKNATLAAYAPYGKKGYGAAIITATGKIYTGCLVENADRRLDATAVANALSQAVAAGDIEIRAAVCIDDKGAITALTPEECQFLYDFGRGILAVMPSNGGKPETRMLGELLPNPVVGQTPTLNID